MLPARGRVAKTGEMERMTDSSRTIATRAFAEAIPGLGSQTYDDSGAFLDGLSITTIATVDQVRTSCGTWDSWRNEKS